MASETSNLSTLAIDTLRIISHSLDAFELGKLWICGDSSLRFKLEAAVDTLVVTWKDSLVSYPKIISSFRSTVQLTLRKRVYDGIRLRLSCTYLKALPRTIIKLHFEFAQVRVFLGPYCSTTLLKDLFPQLAYLEVVETRPPPIYNWNVDQLISALPPTLQHLGLPFDVFFTEKSSDISSLLPSLTYLRASMQGASFGHLKFPASLTSLEIAYCTAVTNAGFLKELPFLNTLRFKEVREPFPAVLEWPPSLSTLHLGGCMTTTVTKSLLKSLPATLTDLTLVFNKKWTPQDFALFPRSLRSLRVQLTEDARYAFEVQDQDAMLHLIQEMEIKTEEMMVQFFRQLPPRLTFLDVSGVNTPQLEAMMCITSQSHHMTSGNHIEVHHAQATPYSADERSLSPFEAKSILPHLPQTLRTIVGITMSTTTTTTTPSTGPRPSSGPQLDRFHFRSSCWPQGITDWETIPDSITELTGEFYPRASDEFAFVPLHRFFPQLISLSTLNTKFLRIPDQMFGKNEISSVDGRNPDWLVARLDLSMPKTLRHLSLVHYPCSSSSLVLDCGSRVQRNFSCERSKHEPSESETTEVEIELETLKISGYYNDMFLGWRPLRPLPTHLHTLIVNEPRYPAALLGRLPPGLRMLKIENMFGVMTNADSLALPRQITFLHLHGSTTELTTQGIRNLPRTLVTISLPNSPQAVVRPKREEEEGEEDQLSILPPLLTNITFFDKTTRTQSSNGFDALLSKRSEMAEQLEHAY